jgi:heat shock protein HslJ
VIYRTVVRWARAFFPVGCLILGSSCTHTGGVRGATPSQNAATPSVASLAGTAWRIEDAGGTAVVSLAQTELRIGTDGRVSGNTGCNSFTGTATIEGSNVTFSPLATTRRACDAALTDQERGILGAMESVKSFSLAEDGTLALLGSDGLPLLRLVRAQ